MKAMLRSSGAAMVAAWAVDFAVSKLREGRREEGGGGNTETGQGMKIRGLYSHD